MRFISIWCGQAVRHKDKIQLLREAKERRDVELSRLREEKKTEYESRLAIEISRLEELSDKSREALEAKLQVNFLEFSLHFLYGCYHNVN